MIVVCPSCSARFQYDEARFQGAPHKRFRCPKCAAVFEVPNPSLAVTGMAPSGFKDGPTAPLPSSAPPGVRATGPEGTDTVSLASVRETTARRDRDSMLSSAGLGTSLPPGMRYSLAFLSGPMSSTVRPLTTPQTVIGREEGDILTKDPECSRRHCRIDVHTDGTVWLMDLGSTNGTFVDGVQIFGNVQLTDRQEFTCGRSTFMLLVRTDDPHAMM
jgi:hypothetical protein